MKKRLIYLLIIMMVAYFGCNEDGTLITPNDAFPKIDTLTATPDTIQIGTETTLICAASDADKDSLTISWESSSGSFPNGQLGANVKWKAPDTAGTYKIIVTVMDSKNVVSDTVIVTALYIAAPVQLAPVNGAVDVSLPVTFEWNAPNGVASYTLQVSTDSLFTSLLFNQSSLTGTTQQVTSFNYLTKYYWRVNGSNSYGASVWSNVFSFRSIGTVPDSITLLSPANNAADVTLPPTLIWNASNGAASYTLQISTVSNFATFVYNQSGLTGTSQQISGLSNSTIYYWRVSATNSYGTSSYSNVRSFTTTAGGSAPTAPTLSSPGNAATGVTIPPTLSWNASPGAESYTLQVSNNRWFDGFILNQSELTATSQQVNGLNLSTAYFWRVSATNSYGTSSYSSIRAFTTGTATISGTVKDNADQVIAGVRIYTSPTTTTVYSDVSGNYSITGFTPRSYTIYAEKPGYQLYDMEFVVGQGQVYTHNIIIAANYGGSTCVGTPTVIYEGITYNTVQIGSQCWLKENLNVGTRINGNQNPTNNSAIEKYCYDDNEANCNTYGGLYQWDEAMQYSTAPGTRGICPPGWHIPTIAEFAALGSAVNNDGNALKAIGQGSGTNTSGFSALLTGFRHYSGDFYNFSYETHFWSSTQNSVFSTREVYLWSYTAYVYYDDNYKALGDCVRCVKD